MKINSLITTPSILRSCALGIALSSFALSANAAVEYGNPGTENVIEYSFTAVESGDIVAYFFGKDEAYYTNTLSMSVNGVATGTTGLNNQTSVYGQSLNLGFANAGDTIVFTLNVADTGHTWYSNKGQNIDGLNHVYSAAFLGDEVIPAGTYVAFEDLAIFDNPDFNYLDEQFVVTNIKTSVVPVPATVWLFGSGLLGLAGITRRRTQTV